MTYADNNPERRNLTILSLAIVIYYIGEGYLINPQISFTLINVGFKNKEALVVVVWVMLIWFLFRYVVTNRHSHGEDLAKSLLQINMDYAPVRTYLINKGVNINQNVNFDKATVSFNSNSNWYIGFPNQQTILSGLDGYLIIKLYLLKIALKHRATTDYYTPYAVFLVAISMGIHKNVMDLSSLVPVLTISTILITIEILYYIRK